MAEKTREVGIRLSVKDAEAVKAALTAFGKDGADALKRIENAGKPASASLLLMSDAIGKSKETGTDFFKSMALSALGPAAALLSVAGAVEGVRASLEKLATLHDAAKAAGLDPEQFQAVAHELQLSGVSLEEWSAAAETFNKNAGQMSEGIGRTYSQLKTLDPELLRSLQLAGNQSDRLNLVADALKKETDGSKAAAIATAVFGQSGTKMVEVLRQGSVELARNQEALKSMGIIMSDDLVERGATLNNQLEALTTVISNDFTKALVSLGPEIVAIAGFMADLAQAIADVFDQMNRQVKNPFAGVSTSDLQKQAAELDQTLHSGKMAIDFWGGGEDRLTAMRKELSERAVTAGLGSSVSGTAPEAFDFQQWYNSGGDKPRTAVDPAAIKAQEELQKKIDSVSKSLALELTNLTSTNREQAENNALARAGIDANSQYAGKIIAAADALYDEKQKIAAVNDAANLLAQTGETAFEDLIDGTKSWQDAMGDLVKTIEKAVLQAELLGSGPLAGLFGTQPATTGQAGGWLGGLATSLVSLFAPKTVSGAEIGGTGSSYNALGGVYSSQSSLHDFVNSVATHPTAFRFARGVGIMGEDPSSPGEAIVPLIRDSRGRLGVSSSQSAAPASVVNNVYNYGNDNVRTQTNQSGGIDVIIGEVDRQLTEGKIGGGFAARYSLRRGMRRPG